MSLSIELELAYDHYKESFKFIKDAEKERGSLFIKLSILVSLLYLFSIDPNNALGLVVDLIKGYSNIDVNFNILTVQSLIWMVILYYTIRYFQVNLSIKRQYKYLHSLEEMINEKIFIDFDREGKDYLSNRPIYTKFVHALYKYIYPLIYIFVIMYKIFHEFKYSINLSMFFIFDLSIAFCIILFLLVYLIPTFIKDMIEFIDKVKKYINEKNKSSDEESAIN